MRSSPPRPVEAAGDLAARLALEGKVRLGLPNDPGAYAEPAHRCPNGLVERLLDEDRAGR